MSRPARGRTGTLDASQVTDRQVCEALGVLDKEFAAKGTILSDDATDIVNVIKVFLTISLTYLPACCCCGTRDQKLTPSCASQTGLVAPDRPQFQDR